MIHANKLKPPSNHMILVVLMHWVVVVVVAYHLHCSYSWFERMPIVWLSASHTFECECFFVYFLCVFFRFPSKFLFGMTINNNKTFVYVMFVSPLFFYLCFSFDSTCFRVQPRWIRRISTMFFASSRKIIQIKCGLYERSKRFGI